MPAVTASPGGTAQMTPAPGHARVGGDAQSYSLTVAQEGWCEVVVQVHVPDALAESAWLECDRIKIHAARYGGGREPMTPSAFPNPPTRVICSG
ncbi:MAG: hypothetical protein U1F87_11080 [Kiritimatiellia bacterium]